MKLIITQAKSIEGYTAAWVAKRALKGDAEIVQIAPGDKLPPMAGREVLIFGVSFGRNLVMKLLKEATSFRMFDNDFKAKQELSGIKEVKVNMTQAPARMAWEYLRADFKVKVGPEKKIDFRISNAPWIVDYSDDAKLWKWPALNKFFIKLAIDNCYKQELEDWDELATRDLGIVLEQGKEFAQKKQQEEKETTDGDTGEESAAGAAVEGDKRVRRQAPRKSKSE